MRLLVAADGIDDRAFRTLLTAVVGDGHEVTVAVPGDGAGARHEYVGTGLVTVRTLPCGPADAGAAARRAVALDRLGLGTAQALVQRELLRLLGPDTDPADVDDAIGDADAVLGWQAATPHVHGVLHRALGYRPTLVHVADPDHPVLRSTVHRRWLRLHRLTAPTASSAERLARLVRRPVEVLSPSA